MALPAGYLDKSLVEDVRDGESLLIGDLSKVGPPDDDDNDDGNGDGDGGDGGDDNGDDHDDGGGDGSDIRVIAMMIMVVIQ